MREPQAVVRLAPLLLLLSACGSEWRLVDDGRISNPPSVFLVSPAEGEVYSLGAPLVVSGVVTDDRDEPATLEVVVSSDVVGEVVRGFPNEIGQLLLSASLPEGVHTLSVRTMDAHEHELAVTRTVTVRGTELSIPQPGFGREAAQTGDALTAIVLEASVANDESPIEYHWQWTLNGATTVYTGPEVPAGVVRAGEVWGVQLWASADETVSKPGVASLRIHNAPPLLGSVAVVSNQDVSRLYCAYDEPTDPEGDALVVRHRWTLDEVELPDTAAEILTPVGPRGARVACEVSVDDGEAVVTARGGGFALPNHAPVLGEVFIGPAAPTEATGVDCGLTSVAHLDPEALTFAWTFTVNSERLALEAPRLDPSLVRRGDRVRCGVVASDGMGGVAEGWSAELEVQNLPPTAPSVHLEPTEIVPGDMATCVVDTAAADPDGDPVSCETMWQVGGSLVGFGEQYDSSRWQPGDTLSCVVVCDDGLERGDAGVASTTLAAPLDGELTAAHARTVLMGTTVGGSFGTSLARVTDVDGDGLDELLVGAPGESAGGRALLFGGDQLVPGATLTPDDARRSWIGDQPGDHLGGLASLAGPGDLDGDGIGELAMAAPWSDSGARDGGSVYLFYGASRAAMDAPAPAAADWQLNGEASDWLGAVLQGGDLDGDGLDELLVGAPVNALGGYKSGAVAVVAGASTRRSGAADLSDVDALILGAPGHMLGKALVVAPDADGDGYAELLLGSAEAAGGQGMAWAVSGGMLGGADPVSDVAWLQLTGSGDGFGSEVASPGDLDGDELADLAFSAPESDVAARDAGLVALFYGRSVSSFSASARDADACFYGDAASAGFGGAMVAAGDLDHDDVGDLLVAAPGSGTGRSGRVSVLYGQSASGWGPSGADADASLIGNAPDDRLGEAMAGGFDLDGDGFAEVALGASHADASASEAGAVYLFSGR